MEFKDRVARITEILSIEYDGSIPEILVSFKSPEDSQLAGHRILDLVQIEEEKNNRRIITSQRPPVLVRIDERIGKRLILDSEYFGVTELLDLPRFGFYVHQDVLGICFSTGPEWREDRVATLVKMLDDFKTEYGPAKVELDPERERFCDEHVATFNACFSYV